MYGIQSISRDNGGRLECKCQLLKKVKREAAFLFSFISNENVNIRSFRSLRMKIRFSVIRVVSLNVEIFAWWSFSRFGLLHENYPRAKIKPICLYEGNRE